LFTALVVAMLLALRRGLWLTAGLFCLLAGLTRVTGLAATAALGLAALYTLWKMWRRSRGAGVDDKKGDEKGDEKVPMAVALSRTRRRTAVLLLTVYAVAGMWYGAPEFVLVRVIVCPDVPAPGPSWRLPSRWGWSRSFRLSR